MESYAVKTKLLRQDNLPGYLLDVGCPLRGLNKSLHSVWLLGG